MTTVSDEELVLWIGETGRPVLDTILFNDAPKDLTGLDVRMRGRKLSGSAVLVDSPAVPDSDQVAQRGAVRWDPQPADVAQSAGRYRFWWAVETAPGSGSYVSLDEFAVRFAAHAPTPI